jgi:hypothetical protein
MKALKVRSDPFAGQLAWIIGVAVMAFVLAGLIFIPR